MTRKQLSRGNYILSKIDGLKCELNRYKKLEYEQVDPSVQFKSNSKEAIKITKAEFDNVKNIRINSIVEFIEKLEEEFKEI